MTNPDTLAILKNTRTIAMVGASNNADRPSYGVMRFLQGHGFRVIPVNPTMAGTELRGEHVYASLNDVPPPIDVVDIFRNSEHAGAAIDDAIANAARLGIHTVWLQIGISHPEGEARAQAAGLNVVNDKCTALEYLRHPTEKENA